MGEAKRKLHWRLFLVHNMFLLDDFHSAEWLTMQRWCTVNAFQVLPPLLKPFPSGSFPDGYVRLKKESKRLRLMFYPVRQVNMLYQWMCMHLIHIFDMMMSRMTCQTFAINAIKCKWNNLSGYKRLRGLTSGSLALSKNLQTANSAIDSCEYFSWSLKWNEYS